MCFTCAYSAHATALGLRVTVILRKIPTPFFFMAAAIFLPFAFDAYVATNWIHHLMSFIRYVDTRFRSHKWSGPFSPVSTLIPSMNYSAENERRDLQSESNFVNLKRKIAHIRCEDFVTNFIGKNVNDS